ncbi:PD40 domain-containing protein [Microscilla marina]|uniref:Outer membrane protein n=1 Tax=Microscilla marina ATCC 23134 TaxID=313606 RepID=A1ZFX1_MICM2|nr:PD40 domain-containing protein [Microscilla marina]EAY30895.1 outer membrane protein [Microscilla marina ATCC 23134]
MKQNTQAFMLFLLAAFFTITLPNQTQAQYSTKNKKAIKYYQKARENLKRRKYDEGLAYLEKAVKKDPKFLEAHYQLASLYTRIFFNEPGAGEKVMNHYQQIVTADPGNKRYIHLNVTLGEQHLKNGKYDLARASVSRYLDAKIKSPRMNKKAQDIIATCDYAAKGMQTPLPFRPTPLTPPLNTLYYQYFPVLTADQNTLIFTGVKNQPSRRVAPDESMYVSYKKNGQWTTPESISDKINTIDNEGTCSISADGKVLVYTVCENRRRGTRRGVIGICDLFISVKVGGKWSEPKNLGPNINTRAWESQPSLSADGKTLYFASKRGGGKGGIDIWVSKMGEDGKWQPAKNLDERVNTPRDEVSPFIHVNGRTLYFSSEGHQGYGGKDLFSVDLFSLAKEKSKNLGYPINDYRDQVGLFITTDGKKGYYTQEEVVNGRMATSKLATFDMPDQIKPKITSNYVQGYVYDAKTKKKLQATIELKDVNTAQLQTSVSSDPQNGSYLIVLNNGAEYALEVKRKGYAFKSMKFNYAKGKDQNRLKSIFHSTRLEPVWFLL